MQRKLIGIAALVLLAASALLWWTQPATSIALAATLKIGLVLAVVWLALPEAQQGLNPLLIVGTLFCVLVLFTRPILFPLALAVWLLLLILRPRTRRHR
jgi:hypothetical protein